MVIQGRKGFASEINGLYKRSNAIHDERPTYTKAGLKGTRLFIYYHSQNNAWALADVIGSSAILGYSSNGGFDAQQPCQTKTFWKITDIHGRFIDDANVICKAEEITISPFSVALRRKKEVNICHNKLSVIQVAELCSELRSSECIIQKLKLFDNNLSLQQIKFITSAIKINKSLTHLQLRGNNLSDDCSDSVSDMIAHNTKLKLLSLRDNSLGDLGFMRIADALKSNSHLEGISLRSNQADTNGLCHLSEALQFNKTLQGIRIMGNLTPTQNISKLVQRAKELSACSVILSF